VRDSRRCDSPLISLLLHDRPDPVAPVGLLVLVFQKVIHSVVGLVDLVQDFALFCALINLFTLSISACVDAECWL
jgi:hypothetical protein